MKQSIFSAVIVYCFVLLFVYTGSMKLTEVHLFKEQLTSSPRLAGWYHNLGPSYWRDSTGDTPGHSSLADEGIVWHPGVDETVYNLCHGNLFHRHHLSCSCGGIIEELSPRQHILFNNACVILNSLAILVMRRQQPTR